MRKKIRERDRARSVSMSLTAQEIYVLEKLATRRTLGGEIGTVASYREAIMQAGTQADIHPIIHSAEGEKPSIEYENWLKQRNWHDGNTEKPGKFKGLYAGLSSSRRRRRVAPKRY